MQPPPKFVVVEVASNPATMTLVQYLITHGFDKFAVVSDLCDHPTLKHKGKPPPNAAINGALNGILHGINGANNGSMNMNMNGSYQQAQQAAHNGNMTPIMQHIHTPASPQTQSNAAAQSKSKKISINDIASALSKKTSPQDARNGFGGNQASMPVNQASTPTPALAPVTPVATPTLSRILEEKIKIKQEPEDRQKDESALDIQKIIFGQMAPHMANFPGLTDIKRSPENCFASMFNSKKEEDDAEVKTESSDSIDFGLGPSDEQIRESTLLLNSLGNAFGFGSPFMEASPSRKRNGEDGSGPTKKHRWMTTSELEESRMGRGKQYGRVHCKATYKCALCGKPTTLNSTGSRWNLLRHVIMIHSESKPYQCYDCDFTGIKSNVISHARQSGHRMDDAMDVTTDEMRAEWNTMLHKCFPDYVNAKNRKWKPEADEENVPSEEGTEVSVPDSPTPLVV